MFIDTLIIGNGFAGRALASKIHGEFLIVERGEKFNIFERRKHFNEMEAPDRHHALIRDAYASKHSFNVPTKLSQDCNSDYILIDGGCSNHWGGLSLRLSENVFVKRDGNFAWPFSYQDIKPFYSQAEQLLRICADPVDPEGRDARGEIKGASKWRAALAPYFPKAYIGAQSHNLSPDDAHNQGICMGAGDCELCPMDAKTRSLHIKIGGQVLNDVMVDYLRFENGKAVEAICITDGAPLSIRFNQVVVAAHGIESLKLLLRSNLPKETPTHLFGHHYQDHAIAELACTLKGASLPFYELNTASQVIIPELSGESEGIEYTTLGLMTPTYNTAMAGALDLDKVNNWQLADAVRDMGATIGLFVLLEIPPEWDLSISYENGKVSVDSSGYHKNKIRYNRIIENIYAKIECAGGVPVKAGEIKHYMKWFGTHHLVGTLGMGKGPRAVVGADFKLKGTDNVFVAGSSLFPRCGSRNPTVTVVALSLMLAEKLNAKSGRPMILRG